MKKLIFSLLILCMFCTCKKDNYSGLCGGNDPIENLPWLKTKINTLQNFSSSKPIIQRLSYQNKTFFHQGSTCTSCSYIPLFFDCNGNELKFTQKQLDDLQSKIAGAEIIWKIN